MKIDEQTNLVEASVRLLEILKKRGIKLGDDQGNEVTLEEFRKIAEAKERNL
jgi:hypothetical protein